MDTHIKIADTDKDQLLDYPQALAFHQGDSIWGVAVAFRMLQLAARFFSQNTLWNRRDLFIVSAHPGPGVKDTIEFITHCISNKQFQLQQGCANRTCSRHMKFEWLIHHADAGCTIKLRDDFVPEAFYAVLDRLNTDQEQKTDKKLFAKFKQQLANKIWKENLQGLFRLEIINAINRATNQGNSTHA